MINTSVSIFFLSFRLANYYYHVISTRKRIVLASNIKAHITESHVRTFATSRAGVSHLFENPDFPQAYSPASVRSAGPTRLVSDPGLNSVGPHRIRAVASTWSSSHRRAWRREEDLRQLTSPIRPVQEIPWHDIWLIRLINRLPSIDPMRLKFSLDG